MSLRDHWPASAATRSPWASIAPRAPTPVSSTADVNTLVKIALRRGRELALLSLTGATKRQVRSMARWEAVLIVAIGLGVGLAIAAMALLPLSHALTGGLRPHIPMDQLGAIL